MSKAKSTDLRSKSSKHKSKYLMRIQQITETSPLTVPGSFTPDLLISKLWLWEELCKSLRSLHIDRVHAVYILGSWTGGMSMILAAKHFPADTVINVDQDPHWIEVSRRMANRMGFDDHMQYMIADVNDLDYRQAKNPSVVINTSTNDIQHDQWFDSIPSGTVVALQGRDRSNMQTATRSWSGLADFRSDFPMQRGLYQGQLPLRDPQTDYNRYMIIGVV